MTRQAGSGEGDGLAGLDAADGPEVAGAGIGGGVGPGRHGRDGGDPGDGDSRHRRATAGPDGMGPAQGALAQRVGGRDRDGVAGGPEPGAEQVGRVVGVHRCSSRSRVSAASLARARLAWLFTVPTEQPSSTATSRSPRSSR